MSACEHAIEYVYFYLDGEQLTWYRRMKIRWHLRKCEHCCGAYEFEERLLRVVRDKGRDEPPPELMDRLRALLRHEAADDPEP